MSRTVLGGLLAVVVAVGVASAPAETGAAVASAGPGAGAAERVEVAAAPARPVGLTLTPVDQVGDFAPGEPVTVTAADGHLTQVALTGQDGTPVPGELAADGRSWRSTEVLGYGKTYTTTATAAGSDGKPVTATSTFSTVRPGRQVSLSMNPLDGQTVGVGQPLAFYFNAAVGDRKAAERAIQISTAPPTSGGFYWFDNKTVFWRPRTYWQAGTSVTVNAAIYGKNLGNGVFGREDRRAGITIGDAVIATADGGTHQMTVTVNGQVARTIPIAMGKRGYETPAGTYVAMSEHTNYTMDSSTYGVPIDAPQGYRTTVAVATRLSNSGIFYHSAPWSVRQQGNSNVSHGCINMSTENARWLQSISSKGDVFIVTNSGGQPLAPTDGLGVWQIPWETWATGGKA
ncbi:MAG TPA: Ig-like domain-containing protein [Actinophytocola sp.]|nr:Ig-like domain-containing protein [Actinophytocola sp.]HEU5472499.1 Ig-like domain-containing protein [Actinophytocola sp.]